MLNSLRTTPRIIGPVHIPEITRKRSLIGKQVMLQLPELQKGFALEVEFGDHEDLRIGRKQILTACGVVYGWGKVKTASVDTHLYVWLREEDLQYACMVKGHRFAKADEVSSSMVDQDITAQVSEQGRVS